MVTIDFSKLEIKTDETMIDPIYGNPRKDVLIYEDCLICHPDMKDKLQEAIELFFTNKESDT